jgi:hypothetical protein
MATIDKGHELMTLVNVFTVRPDKQGELAALLVRATDETMKNLPGFVSASTHRSLDGTKVINYAQWRMQAAAALATFEPIVCEVVDSLTIDKK